MKIHLQNILLLLLERNNNMASNTEEIKNSLRAIQVVFNGLEDYRVLGSLLVASLNKEPHRELHDIDLLIDESIYEMVVSRFKKLGFERITKHAFAFQWDEFQKPNHLTFGVLLKGKFTSKYFEYSPNKQLKLRVDNDYLKPTEYHLYGVLFTGIPLRSIYEGIKIASFNAKRKIDKKIVGKQTNNKLPHGLSLNEAFHVDIMGTEIPYLYTVFSQVYNVIGGVRLKLGKPYDTFR